ncbi:hypothetical protein AK812_SmicGene9176 [Symbiodinium microadriaticum]|uniref:Uncharacterized protein n=1 Tax=Symbiodinium microadriaticum TaxID=2951 RepID=A0A1Q9EJ41_SYMMI|nr:hypothetical protein AK812_SmicGene9176 [Symbiodinium microadriaticum]
MAHLLPRPSSSQADDVGYPTREGKGKGGGRGSGRPQAPLAPTRQALPDLGSGQSAAPDESETPASPHEQVLRSLRKVAQVEHANDPEPDQALKLYFAARRLAQEESPGGFGGSDVIRGAHFSEDFADCSEEVRVDSVMERSIMCSGFHRRLAICYNLVCYRCFLLRLKLVP